MPRKSQQSSIQITKDVELPSLAGTGIRPLAADADGNIVVLTGSTSGATVDLTNYYTTGQTNTLLAGKSNTGHTHTFQSITDRPTTLSGYGITDAFTGHTVTNGIQLSGNTLSAKTAGAPDVSGLEANVSGLTLNISGYTTTQPVSVTTTRTLRLDNGPSSVLFDPLVPGIPDPSFVTATGFGNQALKLVLQPDGKVIVGGFFTVYQGVSANRIIRLNDDGSRDSTFTVGTGFNNTVTGLAFQPDGKTIVVGQFTTYQGVSTNRIIRLNDDGSRDNTFAIGTGFEFTVNEAVIQPDGKVLVGGRFTTYQGVSAPYFIRLNADGSRDNSFASGTGFNGDVDVANVQPDGKIIVGGQFTSYNGVSAPAIIRLNADGSPDNAFNIGSGFDNRPFHLNIRPDGKIIVGGSFTTYQGVSANHIVRLNPDGSRDGTFTVGTGFNGGVSTVSVQPGGRMLVGGSFTTYQGLSSPYFVRLNADGSRDASLVSGFGPIVSTIVLQPDGKALVCGNFSTYQGVAANRIIRLLLAPPTLLVTSPAGIEYAADYSASYSPRSLTDKAYVDGQITGHTHTFQSITAKPTTLSGYGITDGGVSLPGTGNQIVGALPGGALYRTTLNPDNLFGSEPLLAANILGIRGSFLSFDVDLPGNRYFVATGNNITVLNYWDNSVVKIIPVGAPINAMAYVPGNTLICYSYLLNTAVSIDITTNAQTLISFPANAVHLFYNASNNTVYGGDVSIGSYNVGTGAAATIIAGTSAALFTCPDQPGSPFYYTTQSNNIQRRRLSDNSVVATSPSVGSPLNPLFVEKDSGLLYATSSANDRVYDSATLTQVAVLPVKFNLFAYVRGYGQTGGMVRNTPGSALSASGVFNFRIK